MSEPAFPAKIGLIAGGGDFPLFIARAARGCGVEVVALAINGFAARDLAECADRIFWIELGQVAKAIELLHENNITAVAMAGKVPHTSVLQYRHFDLRAMKLLARTLNRKPDSLLGMITSELEAEGIRVLDSSLFLKSLMPEAGLITPNRSPSERELNDIEFGIPIAKVIAGQDVGQTIVVKEMMVIAVEGVEGTDECVRRAAGLAGPGCVVVKVSKPSQDLRFDIPVVGITTVEVLRACGCSALAVSARESLIFDRDRVVPMAEEADIAIIAR